MKKLISLALIGFVTISLTGCFKRDDLEDITIYTTAYPMEFITDSLYGTHSEIHSIYPDGIDIRNYKLTEKQIKDDSKASMFIFNGLSNEKDYVIPMVKENKNMKIIDTSLSMEYNTDIEQLWLDPSNFLMLSQNIRNGLKEYIANHYLRNEIDENYNKLKIEVSKIDAELKLMSESSNNKTIVVSSDTFKFLEKYNFTVISLEENGNLTDKIVEDVRAMITNGTIDYIFTKQYDNDNSTVKRLQAQTGVALTSLHSLSNISEKERLENKNYISIMNDNIELLKNELYD